MDGDRGIVLRQSSEPGFSEGEMRVCMGLESVQLSHLGLVPLVA